MPKYKYGVTFLPNGKKRAITETEDLKHRLESGVQGINDILNSPEHKLYSSHPAFYYALCYWVRFMKGP